MKRIALIIVVAAVAGCGADGAPWRPSANVGISIGTGGVSPSANLGASNGPVSVAVGL
ncbi:hypothetical protein [Yoonia sp.]|jgi:TRAP-type uncharacterized transport system substrate-binding protein|uniref:hypothetical protein n=1 Tax=Yoonia sp. TaxID=2212373 RepID=UPI0025F813D7|nr:hypothetical protein [Yoonia sp.]